MDIQTPVQVVIGTDCNGEIRIAGGYDGCVRVGLEKISIRRYKTGDRKPHMIDSGKYNGGIDPDPPDSGNRVNKAQGGKIAALRAESGGIGHCNSGRFYGKADSNFAVKGQRNALNGLACGRYETYGIDFRGIGP